jgi:hypothetical protein
MGFCNVSPNWFKTFTGYNESAIGLMIDEEGTVFDRRLIRFLFGFSKMLTNLPVGLHTSSISNDELVVMNERANRFIEKFRWLQRRKKNLIEPSAAVIMTGSSEKNK